MTELSKNNIGMVIAIIAYTIVLSSLYGFIFMKIDKPLSNEKKVVKSEIQKKAEDEKENLFSPKGAIEHLTRPWKPVKKNGEKKPTLYDEYKKVAGKVLDKEKSSETNDGTK